MAGDAAIRGIRRGLTKSPVTVLCLTTAATAAAALGANPAVLLLTILLLIGIAEQILGAGKTLITVTAGSLIGALTLAGLNAYGQTHSDSWLGYVHGNALSPGYGGAAAALGAATARLDPLWKRRVRTWLLALSSVVVLHIGTAQSLILLVGSLAGVLAGHYLTGRTEQSQRRFRVPPTRERRFLLATVVGVFAVGPVLTQLSGALAVGPFSAIGSLTLQNRPSPEEITDLCGGRMGCVALQNAVGVNSPGAVVLAIIPLVLLLLCSEGLRRGRRLALWTAVTINGVFAAVALLQIVNFLLSTESDETPAAVLTYTLPAVWVPSTIAMILVINRGLFQVGSGRGARRSLAKSAASLILGVALAYLGAWLAEGNSTTGPASDLVPQLVHLLIPFPLPLNGRLPQGILTTAIYSLGGSALWLVFGVLALRHFRLFPGAGAFPADERLRVKKLLFRGGGSLSWMAIWKDNRYWFSPDGTSCVPYQLHHGVALTVGGPVGEPASRDEAARGFVAFCVEQGLTPAFYSVSEDAAQCLRDMNFRALPVAEEALLNVDSISFSGKEWQNVRSATNRAKKLAVTAEWLSYSAMTPALRRQIAEISQEWLAERLLPEMGFTLGGVEELKDEEVLCCLAVDEEGLVHGLTSWLPVYTEGRVTSWTLDLMRRRRTAFKGVMEFLIGAAITRFKSEVSTVSLSGSPLAGPPEQYEFSAQTAVSGIIAMLGNALEPLYGLRSLAAFKSRFRPEYRTLYLCYQDPLALPSISMALMAAYFPAVAARRRSSLLRRIVSR